MDNSTTFTNRMTVRAYESKHQCKIHVRPHKTKEGIYLYYHSNAEDANAIGLVSQRAVDILSVEGDSAWDKLMIADCHYIDNTGKQQTCKMLMLSNLKMNTKAYPLISEYVEAIKLAEDNLEQLSYLRPVINDDGLPVMSNGNFATVFKMKDERNGKFYALKCFIKEQEGRNEAYKQIADELEFVSSEFIIPIKFYEKELFVNTSNGDETEFPVLLMDWVEGVTLDKYVRSHQHDQYALQLISYQFCRMAAWLMAQPFAHGDLKPDNILVKDDGSLVLVDYDGMFVPAMKGQKAREIGSPDYRHPARTIDDFNESIDDFSLATIAMQLYAIALQPELLTGASGDTLMLCEKDYRDLEKSKIMTELFSLVGNSEFEKLLAIFLLAHSEMSLSKLSFRIFNINKPVKPNVPILISTEVTEDDLRDAVTDEYGAKYSSDGKKLLSGPFLIDLVDKSSEPYQIKDGTIVICDESFDHHQEHSIVIPSSVRFIGKNPFKGHAVNLRCESKHFVIEDDLLMTVDKTRIIACVSHATNIITIPKSVEFIDENAFFHHYSWHYDHPPYFIRFHNMISNSFRSDYAKIIVPNEEVGRDFVSKGVPENNIINNGVYIDPYGAIYSSDRTKLLCYPKELNHKEYRVIEGCKELVDGAFNYLPDPDEDGMYVIGNKIITLYLPKSLVRIGSYALQGCTKLKKIVVPHENYKAIQHILENYSDYQIRNIANFIVPSISQ